jgi:Ni/Fe-hydrogenase subunit HybB-like protein
MHDIPIPSEVRTQYLSRSKQATLLFGSLVAVGALAFGVQLTTNPDRAWQAYVANWLFFTGLATGAVMLSVITAVVKARWNWSVRRISVAFGAFLPISYLLMLPMLRLRESYFPWIAKMNYDPIVQAKAAYLNIPFLITRNLIAPAVLFGAMLLFIYWMLRPDLGPERAGDEGGDAGRARWRERIAGNWLGRAEEEARSWQKIKRLAPVVAILYAVVMSFAVIDWAMSLEPHWFSTLFPGWYFMGSVWGGVATTIITMVLLKRGNEYFDDQMGPYQQHDLGKLLFGFSIFWTYLFFSQYIVIWYGKLPWEQEWIIHRSGAHWGPLALLVIILCFLVPFIGLMARSAKLNPTWLASVAVIAMIGLWLERWMLIAPSLLPEDAPAFSVFEPLIALGFLGLFAGSARWFLATFPAIQLWQVPEEPELLEAEQPLEVAGRH